MLTLRVTSIDGQPPLRPIEAILNEGGGTIGRAEDSDLVLPDSERYISRLHARVSCADGAFSIAVLGGNPIEVNGAPIVRGAGVALRDGDVLRIAGYVVGVRHSLPRVEPAPVAQRPARDPLGGLLSPADGSANRGTAAALPPATDSDPLGLGLKDHASSPLHPVSTASRIPDDFDPFADPTSTPRRGHAALVADDGSLGLGALLNEAPSIDSLFDLAPGGDRDPFAEGALSGDPAPAGKAPSLDPLAPWQPEARPVQSAPSQSDAVPEIHGSFRMPVSRPAAPPTGRPHAAADGSGVQDNSIFLSWNDDSDEVAETGLASASPDGRPADPLMLFDDQQQPVEASDPLGLGPTIRPMRPAAAPDASRWPTSSPAAPPPPPREPTPSEAIVPSAPDRPVRPPPGVAPVEGLDPSTGAFVKGLGTANVVTSNLTPEQMEQIGALLREATSGTLALLLARAMTKREVRADVTMIVAKGNNPLKFSPNVDVALAHLMASRRPGFLTPVDAMRDAYDDLRSHQFGFMAGLRAALSGVLRRFDPATLEKRLTPRSLLDNVLPMNRRAKLWDQYEQLYRDIAVEAEEDFHTLFGREFLRAYEEQVAKLAEAEQGSASEVR